jgi:hypothetical protein
MLNAASQVGFYSAFFYDVVNRNATAGCDFRVRHLLNFEDEIELFRSATTSIFDARAPRPTTGFAPRTISPYPLETLL